MQAKYLKKIEVPTPIIQGDDDQIVPMDDSATLSALNADLLEFLKA